MGILYYILAQALFIMISPIGIIYGIITKPKLTNRKLTRLAESINRKGNVLCAELFNACLLKTSQDSFGDGRETISSVLGRNEQEGTLSGLGRVVVKVLDRIEKDHCWRNIGW